MAERRVQSERWLLRPSWGDWEPDPALMEVHVPVLPTDVPNMHGSEWVLLGAPVVAQICGWVVAVGYALSLR